MEKRLLASLFLLLLAVSFISASVEFDMKEEFLQDEMLIAKISGDFTQPPIKENVFFYRGHVKIPIDMDIAKFGEDYYLYASLIGKKQANYSVLIKDIEYTKADKAIKEDLTKNFTILNETASFTLDKGFFSAKDDFYIELENFQEEDLEIEFEITTLEGEEGGITNYEEDESHEITINPGKERINLELGAVVSETIKQIEFRAGDLSYAVPVLIFLDEASEQVKLFSFKIQPEEINLEVPTSGDPVKRLVYIYNTGTGTLTDLKLSLSESLKPYVMISEDEFGRIVPESNANLNLSITPAGAKSITGKLTVESAQALENSIRISITFVEGAEPEIVPEVTTGENCAEIGGQICKEEEVCKDTDEVIYANDGVCCLAGCKGKASGATTKIIGFLLIGAVVIVVVWFLLVRYKSKRKPVDLLKVARGKK